MSNLTPIARVLAALRQRYGNPKRPRVREPFAQILHENVAYLVSDERRAQAFTALEARVGLTPAALLAAEPRVLREITALGGMHPDARASRLLECAELARDLDVELAGPLAQQRKALRRFPGIGAPGADKILLFAGLAPLVALESNGLRVLLRLGVVAERKGYAQSHKAATELLGAELPATVRARVEAWQLLRMHGQELCKSNAPRCLACPLASGCAYARA